MVDYWKTRIQEPKSVDVRNQHLLEVVSGYDTFDSIVELGHGKGVVISEFIDKFKPSVAVGVDSSEIAVKNNKKYDTVKHDLNILPLPFYENEFDLVIACDIFEHVKDPKALLEEAVRVGNTTLVKIPVENTIWNTFREMTSGRPKAGMRHPSGHLHKWNMSDIKQMIERYSIENELIIGNQLFRANYFGVIV